MFWIRALTGTVLFLTDPGVFSPRLLIRDLEDFFFRSGVPSISFGRFDRAIDFSFKNKAIKAIPCQKE